MHKTSRYYHLKTCYLSILILIEVSLIPQREEFAIYNIEHVSILVLMEVTLLLILKILKDGRLQSFNPCFNGSYSSTSKGAITECVFD